MGVCSVFFVCVCSQACFSLHFQIGRSALVASSSSLPSFPSTLSWSRDESARRVKYTLNGLPWRRGSAPGRFVLGRWPSCPCPLLTALCLHETALGSWFLTAAGTCPHAHLFLERSSLPSLLCNSTLLLFTCLTKLTNQPIAFILSILSNRKLSWLLVKYNRANLSHFFWSYSY